MDMVATVDVKINLSRLSEHHVMEMEVNSIHTYLLNCLQMKIYLDVLPSRNNCFCLLDTLLVGSQCQ
jgi:hypothetical protein